MGDMHNLISIVTRIKIKHIVQPATPREALSSRGFFQLPNNDCLLEDSVWWLQVPQKSVVCLTQNLVVNPLERTTRFCLASTIAIKRTFAAMSILPSHNQESKADRVRGLPQSLVKQLLFDVEASPGKLEHLHITKLCNKKTDIYGEPRSYRRTQVKNKLVRWKADPSQYLSALNSLYPGYVSQTPQANLPSSPPQSPQTLSTPIAVSSPSPPSTPLRQRLSTMSAVVPPGACTYRFVLTYV
jgi:hypothetical protein